MGLGDSPCFGQAIDILAQQQPDQIKHGHQAVGDQHLMLAAGRLHMALTHTEPGWITLPRLIAQPQRATGELASR